LQIKLCDPCLSALCVPWCEKALYKYPSFPFLSFRHRPFRQVRLQTVNAEYHTVTLHEPRQDPTPSYYPPGRSITTATRTRGREQIIGAADNIFVVSSERINYSVVAAAKNPRAALNSTHI